MLTRRSRGGTASRPALADLAGRAEGAAQRSSRAALAVAALFTLTLAAPPASAEPATDKGRVHLSPSKGPRAETDGADEADASDDAAAEAK
ncbi:MAG: hypothetical protein KC486_06050, partial [Myxococcales bacterium]|nr:hypothetical protein [Myxococcales bacterium]